ncbi:spermidine/putrescine transport system substrate-binding protein [Sinorhizobium kostiense]|uniref:Spermidine/putrescine transport system substrate-binding protein n=1 Tax=Sinorhizobium kostiense TaxID=76747 RepID=A0ABS4QXR3_9HYPH|nr:spermidine/putrescine ABC transporter substrate-binding protein [Sinorhizobium kostiense]MBP2235435.1 spermidine/putrescine transport system substrate-binding protein [Sinorhizobium kostiense]
MRGCAAITVFLATLIGATASHAETLNLLIWEAYIDQALVDRWTEKTGVTVHQINFDSDDARDDILAAGGSNVDVVIVDENGAELFGNKGVLEPLSPGNLPVLNDYAPAWADRCAGYGLPYFSGTVGILYRSDVVKEPPTSWRDLMSPAQGLRKHISMFSDHDELFVPPLMLLGASINVNDTETLRAAFGILKAQAPFVLTYNYVITAIQDSAISKEIHMALGYSGDQHVLNEKVGKPSLWRYSVPEEGTLSWLDCVSIIAASPQKKRALEFLSFIGSPEGAAANALSMTMPTTSTQALKLLPHEVRSNPEIYPPAEVLARSQYLEQLSIESVQARRRIISTLANFQ